MMEKKIMICGASGTGKTTLAKHISSLYELPYISTSASNLWGNYGFKSHQDSLLKCMMGKNLGLTYQWDILINRSKELSEYKEFITDRSYIDNITYILLQMGFNLTGDEINSLLKAIRNNLLNIDGIIFIRFNDQVILEDNGVRIINPYYQSMVDSVMEMVIRSDIMELPIYGKVLELKHWDFETRIKIVDKWVNNL